ncbi:MAG: 3-deoxy-7-phosphoheptulonate synthase [Thermodesulfovibrionales bacterium]|nr:3-deoxy-7-phosphoheptulonate synthase [Thermodesulfovibrionales bacterium]
MIIVLKPGCKPKQLESIVKQIEAFGLKAHVSQGTERTVIGAIGDDRGKHELQNLEGISCVERIVPILKPYKLASLEFKKEHSQVKVKGARFGLGSFGVIAGPCSVENEKQIIKTAQSVKASGARMLRGGAYKPRTSPYSFQGMEEEGLKLLAKARKETGLPFVTEVINEESARRAAEYADVLQIGARNVQNFSLLKTVGKTGKPVLLKRGMSTTIQEWLMSAEYILSEGGKDIILCERGIRTFETATRNTLDISAIPVVKELSHLPIVIDPSHATGVKQYVEPLSFAAMAAGADGLIVEVHNDPSKALCDGPQSLDLKEFAAMMVRIKALSKFNKQKL